jgi:tetratricopeptide (TPR) repeat protein
MTSTCGRFVLLGLALGLGACATSRGVRQERLEFEPLVITPGPPEQLELAHLNDEELLALGTSAFAAEDFEKAARCFVRLLEAYPQSPHQREAIFNAGLAYERLGRFAEALELFKQIMEPAKGLEDALHAAFRAAECHYHLNEFPAAIAILSVLAEREDIPAQERLQAKVERGICLIENDDLDQAEAALRASLNWWRDHREAERLDEYFPGQAQFFLGEIYRLYFEKVDLQPDSGDEKLAKDLEYKCELLLSAQGHYLRAIRIGDVQWATAAGFRIGALYEQLYDDMLGAKAPTGFDEEQAQVYREELRKKVRVLLTKAMSIYERTLAAAERIGVENPFVQRTKRSLDRMKQLLLEDEPNGAAGPPSNKAAEPRPGS